MTSESYAVVVRPALADDVLAVRSLFRALHEFNAAFDPWFTLADGWEELLDTHLEHVRRAGHGLALMAWAGPQPIGLLLMDRQTDPPLFRHRQWVELQALYVVPEVRGQGVADQLMAKGLAWARERGHGRVQLYVTTANQGALRFYTKAGFCPVQEILRLTLDPAVPRAPIDVECPEVRSHDLVSIHQRSAGANRRLTSLGLPVGMSD